MRRFAGGREPGSSGALLSLGHWDNALSGGLSGVSYVARTTGRNRNVPFAISRLKRRSRFTHGGLASLAVIVLMEPALNANYQAVKQSTYAWSKVEIEDAIPIT